MRTGRIYGDSAGSEINILSLESSQHGNEQSSTSTERIARSTEREVHSTERDTLYSERDARSTERDTLYTEWNTFHYDDDDYSVSELSIRTREEVNAGEFENVVKMSHLILRNEDDNIDDLCVLDVIDDNDLYTADVPPETARLTISEVGAVSLSSNIDEYSLKDNHTQIKTKKARRKKKRNLKSLKNKCEISRVPTLEDIEPIYAHVNRDSMTFALCQTEDTMVNSEERDEEAEEEEEELTPTNSLVCISPRQENMRSKVITPDTGRGDSESTTTLQSTLEKRPTQQKIADRQRRIRSERLVKQQLSEESIIDNTSKYGRNIRARERHKIRSNQINSETQTRALYLLQRLQRAQRLQQEKIHVSLDKIISSNTPLKRQSTPIEKDVEFENLLNVSFPLTSDISDSNSTIRPSSVISSRLERLFSAESSSATELKNRHLKRVKVKSSSVKSDSQEAALSYPDTSDTETYNNHRKQRRRQKTRTSTRIGTLSPVIVEVEAKKRTRSKWRPKITY